uniref:non-specific serine/threonine protein kinase n=1 Tax=Mola mola TaxID=94237 RepID=A0A3Q4BZ49_MOLML
METVGKFEFSRKDLIGHGAFAVVFKGRHREKHEWEVAVKCINKKNLAKSQTLLGKEIKILKELKHENIVALLDFQVRGSQETSFLFTLYCNGGDLADYLHSKGTLSEDTIRVFLQQIAGAMRVLQAKGIIHRDLKPQNILLSNPPGRKSHFNNTCIKIADFGFARYLQNNMMAATLCGSPMYMAPEVIMSLNYDAKADLWSMGTIVFQCLTGKAPFQVTSQMSASFGLHPLIPRETSSHLRHLLLGLLQRNHRDRMDFARRRCSPCFFFVGVVNNVCPPQQSLAEGQHLRVKAVASPTQEAAGFLLKESSGGGGSSKNSSSCDTDDFVMVPAHFTGKKTWSPSEDVNETDMSFPPISSLLASAGLCAQARTPPHSPGPLSHGQSSPIPVPTQLHNYQRLEQNLQSAKQDGSPLSTPVRRCSSGSPLGVARGGPSPLFWQGGGAAPRRLSLGGARPFLLSAQAAQQTEPRPASQQYPQPGGLGTRLHSAPCLLEFAGGAGRQKIRKQHSEPAVTPSAGLMTLRPLHSSPRLSELMQRSPLPTILGSPSRTIPPFEFPNPPSSPNLVNLLTQQGLVVGSPGRTGPVEQSGRSGPGQRREPERRERRRRSACQSLYTNKRMCFSVLLALFYPLAPSGGGGGHAPGSGSPVPVVFTVGSPPSGNISRQRKYSGSSFSSLSSAGSFTGRHPQTGTYPDAFEAPSSPRYSFTDPFTANMGTAVTFEAPELPEETLMEQEHTDTVQSLRFTLDFARCLMEVAGARGAAATEEQEDLSRAPVLQQQSLVADQISSLSREWSHAEQLVLYLKSAELLSAALHTAMDRVKQGKLYPSATVKQVVRKLNELYKSSVASCRSLSIRLERFFTRKHRLMDQVTSITAERLLFSHTVQMVQAAALDEMFHHGEASALRYHKALLLMEGLSQLLTEQDDIVSVSRCKECIERRLTALQSGLCV